MATPMWQEELLALPSDGMCGFGCVYWADIYKNKVTEMPTHTVGAPLGRFPY